MIRVLCLTSQADTLISIRPEAELFIGLAKAGVNVHVLTQEHSIYLDRMRSAGVQTAHFEPLRKISPNAIRVIREYILQHDINIVYAFNNRAISNAVWACRGLPVKLLTYRGQTGNIERYDPSSLLTHRHPRVDGIICVAHAVERYLRPRIAQRVSIDTVHKGHDLSWYQDPPAERKAFGLNDDNFVIGCVANNRPRKGVNYLIDAFELLHEHADARLMLIGHGMQAHQLNGLPKDRDIRNRIHCLGPRHDVESLVQLFDVAVLPSIRREGLPKTVIEAMAYGVACIATNTGGNAELVQHEVTGFVVPTADSQALAGALRTLKADAPRRKSMGDAGRERIRMQFNVADTVSKTLVVFERHWRA